MKAPKHRQMMRLGIVLAVLAGALVAAPFALAARSEFFGIAQGQYNADGQLDAQDLGQMATNGVHTNRFEIGWKSVEATKGTYKWGPSDRFIGALAKRGIRAAPFVWGSPRWVSTNPGSPPIDTAAHELAWKSFLGAAVARYQAGGAYWRNKYHEQYGALATPVPVRSWQVWNEPNLAKFFNPGGTDAQTVQRYARLLRISHDAIKSKDPKAKVVLAGNPGYPPSGGLKAWEFLNRLYGISGIKAEFDVAALHPYASTLYEFGNEIRNVRSVIRQHGDQDTPLWLTEFGWGSAPPDRFGINQGLTGQQTLLRQSFKLALQNRANWNVQRLFWFLWRDPAPDSQFANRCSFCSSAGLLRHDRTAKPSFAAYKSYSAEKTPPRAMIAWGPREGGFTNDPTPTFGLSSTEPGSTYLCRVAPHLFKPCSSPRTVGPLSDGAHTFYLRAIDAPGNESQILARHFTVDTQAPPVPRITDTDPDSPANNNHPRVKGAAAKGPTVRIYRTAGCTGTPLAAGSATDFASPGLSITVADNTTTSLRASARDVAGNVSGCSAPFTYVEDSVP
jgi:hypothetical protein